MSNWPAILASASLIVAPTALKIVDKVEGRSEASAVEETLCITKANTPVERRYGGQQDIAARLKLNDEVTALEERGDFRRIAYEHGNRPRVGWVRKDALGACEEEPAIADELDNEPTSAQEQGTRLHPFGRPIGDVARAQLLENIGYDCLYDPALKYCRWVGYCYKPGGESPPRHKGFFADRRLEREDRAEPQDYAGAYKGDLSGFDKGHLAPDATIKALGIEAQKETYSLANITPQFSLTNQGIWRELEDHIRGWASAAEPVCVETGPVFFQDQAVEHLEGPNRLAIPHGYFAIIVQGETPNTLAFLVPNVAERHSFAEVSSFAESIDRIEELTGFDYLPALPDNTERVLEAEVVTEVW